MIGAVVTAVEVVGGERRQLPGVGKPVDVAEVGGDGDADELLAGPHRSPMPHRSRRSTAYSVVPSATGSPDAGAPASAMPGTSDARESSADADGEAAGMAMEA